MCYYLGTTIGAAGARYRQIDEYQSRGGGPRPYYAATIADKEPEALAERIGLASQPGPTKYLPFAAAAELCRARRQPDFVGVQTTKPDRRAVLADVRRHEPDRPSRHVRRGRPGASPDLDVPTREKAGSLPASWAITLGPSTTHYSGRWPCAEFRGRRAGRRTAWIFGRMLITDR